MVLTADSDAGSNSSQPLLRRLEAAEDVRSESPNYGTDHQEEAVKNYAAPASLKRRQVDLVNEIALVIKTTAPLVASYALQYGITLTTISVVGQLGKHELAAAALASTIANITGFAIYEGLNTALDTLCSQAYGAGRFERVGIYLQRMICLLSLATIPIGVVWLCSPWLLALFIPEVKIAIMAGNFLRVLLIGFPGLGIFMAGRRFFLAQGFLLGPLLVTLVAVPVNIVLSWLLVFRFEYGFLGAALALSITRLTMPALLVAYVLLIQPSYLKCWFGLRASAFQDWGDMARLSVAGIITVETESFAFEMSTVAAAFISPTHLAAQSIVKSVCDVMLHISFSTAAAIATRLGNLVGAGDLSAARVATRAFCIVATMIGISNGLFIFAFRRPITSLFSHDQAVLDLALETIPLISIVLFFDSTAATINALLRGLGRQSVGACINLAVHYMVRTASSRNPLETCLFLTNFSSDWSPAWPGTLLRAITSKPVWPVDWISCRTGNHNYPWWNLLQMV